MKEIKIRRALLSVSDKRGIVELAQKLKEYECEIISTGGTRKILEKADIEVTDIMSVTGNPEAFGGRMKTISFNIESALLFDREKDRDEAEKLNIDPIDLVVCNLYPFEKKVAENAELPELIENIDIGGPTMLRAAAKNYQWVSVLTDQADYADFIRELGDNGGSISLETRFELMRKTFNHTADYDAAIAVALDKEAGSESVRFAFHNGKKLRYGENSHQKAQILEDKRNPHSLANLEQLHGKEISYNNILDIEAAINAVHDVPEQAISVVKHLNSCGFAMGADQRKVFELAWSGDPVSAFGSIIACNRKLELATVEFLQLNAEKKSERKFIEVIIAPDYSKEALEYLCFHKNLRVIRYDPQNMKPADSYRYVFGALLKQDADNILLEKTEQVTMTESSFEPDQTLIEFGLRAVRNIKSNAIVIVQRYGDSCRLLGMGTGQPNRLISTKLAIEKAKENLLMESDCEPDDKETFCSDILEDCIMISDAYFPFPDNIEYAAAKGIRTVVQPGGSMRDKKVFKRAAELGVTMLLTGLRHFKH